jgi:hypothetical protein
METEEDKFEESRYNGELWYYIKGVYAANLPLYY